MVKKFSKNTKNTKEKVGPHQLNQIDLLCQINYIRNFFCIQKLNFDRKEFMSWINKLNEYTSVDYATDESLRIEDREWLLFRENLAKIRAMKIFKTLRVEKVLKIKVNIAKKVFDLIKNSRLETFIFSVLMKKRALYKFVPKKLLIDDFGFNENSVKVALKNLEDKGLLIRKNGAIKLSEFCRFEKGSQYYKIADEKTWILMFLQMPKFLESLKLFLKLEKGKNLLMKHHKKNIKNQVKILCHNNYLKLSKSQAYRMLRKFGEIVGLKLKELFDYQKTYDKQKKKFITYRFLKMDVGNSYAVW